MKKEMKKEMKKKKEEKHPYGYSRVSKNPFITP
jgi:hypothetical protein